MIMKRRYAFILSGAMLFSMGMFACSSETTTGVDTETTENEVDGRINDEDEGNITDENISPLDTANNVQ
jgi:hypothetical protein